MEERRGGGRKDEGGGMEECRVNLCAKQLGIYSYMTAGGRVMTAECCLIGPHCSLHIPQASGSWGYEIELGR